MSQENVEILLNASTGRERWHHRRTVRILPVDPRSRGPVDSARRSSRPWGEFHGIDRAREYYGRWASAWEEWDWEIEEARANGDLVVTRTWLRGRGRGSGLVLDMRIGQVWTFRDGRVIRYEALPSWEQALEAAGLRE